MRFRSIKTGLIAAAVLLGMAGVAVAVGADQPNLVSPTPSKATPNINDGNVYSIVQVGSRIIVGGNFTNANPPGDTNSAHTVTRNSILAFDAATGQIDTGFVPALTGEVRTLLPGPTADTVYVGGVFPTVNGIASRNLALLSTVTGAPVSGFTPTGINGGVWAIQHVGSRLLIGGEFTSVGGTAHDGIAAVGATNGAVDNAFINVQFTGHHNYNGTSGANGAVGIHEMDVSPDGTRAIVVGNFKNADGVLHDQIAMIDLAGSSATLDPSWNTAGYTAACASNSYDTYMRGVSFSPDGTYFVVVATGGGTNTFNTDGTRAMCDTASRWTTTDTGTDVQPVWIDYSGNDSFESVTVTTHAIYAGGHFRWNNNANGIDSAGTGAVPRPGISALDPLNGLPYSWNPGRNPRGAGAYTVYATPSGLYIGADTNSVGTGATYAIRGRIAFFPLTGGEVIPTYTPTTLPANVFLAGDPGSANPNVLQQVAFTGGSAGSPVAVTTSGVDWSNVRGAFLVGNKLFYGYADGNFYVAPFNGTLGAPSLVDPYDDPVWSNIQTGSGQTYRGLAPSLYGTEMTNVQGMFLTNGRLYYSIAGQSALRYRYFEPDDGIIGSQEFTADGTVNFSNIAGMFMSGTTLYYADKATDNLHSVDWNDGAPSSTSDSLVSGPGISGVDWRTEGMFALPLTGPTATYAFSCIGLTCSFDGTGASGNGSTITSYDWDFGDGTPHGSGVTTSHVYAASGTFNATLTIKTAQSDNAVAHAVSPSNSNNVFTAISPTRLLDTRSGLGAPKSPVGPNGTVSLQVAGQGGVPPSGVTAVVMNVTAVGPSSATFITAYPDGQPLPSASNLNVAAGQTLPNLVTVRMINGKVDLHNTNGSVNLLADVTGYYTGAASGSTLFPLTPTRILDTRISLGAKKASTVKLLVAGKGGIPPTGVTAVVMNVTAVNPSAASYLTVYPDGAGTVPNVSNLNFAKGQTVPNLVVVPVHDGYVDLHNASGSVDLLADVTGYYGSGGSVFHPTDPSRVMDTRHGINVPVAAVGPNGIVSLNIAGVAGIPANVSAVVVNVTVTAPTAYSYLTVYPDGHGMPGVSNLNFAPGQTIANLVVVQVKDGKIDFHNQYGSTQVIADLTGYFTN